MRSSLLLLLSVSLVLGGFVANPALAQWVEHGVPLAAYSGYQYLPDTLPDGEGGAFVAWSDGRSTTRIYVQRIDAYGRALWTAGGVMNPDTSGYQYTPKLVTDGAGGIIVVYEDQNDLRAQRFDGDGNALWNSSGMPVCVAANNQYNAGVYPDGNGGIYVSWVDSRTDVLERNIYAQRLNSSGAPLWTVDGVPVCTSTGLQTGPKIVPSIEGGAIVCWFDYRSGNYDVYAQGLDSGGTYQWTYQGEPIITLTGNQQRPQLLPDGVGGAFLVWDDYRSGYDVYAQHVDLDGSALWAASGMAIAATTGSQLFPRVVSDAAGGFIVAWQDNRFGDDDIYAQRVDFYGNLLWDADGELVVSGPGDQEWPIIASDGQSGAVIAWQDYRSGNCDIYARRIDSSGTALADSLGEPIVIAPNVQGFQDQKVICSDGAGGAFVFWADARDDVNDLYGQRFERNGNWGYPSASITEARDVPGDQGGDVYLAWSSSRLDPWPELGITEYSVWRSLNSTLMRARLGRENLEGLRIEKMLGQTFYWEKVVTIPAAYLPGYSTTVATLYDSTDVATAPHYFQVIAHTSNPTVFWASAPDSARSVDNLAPVAPLNLIGEAVPDPLGLRLSWSPNIEPDVDHYLVHRSPTPAFEPDAGNFLTSTPDTTTTDGSWQWSDQYYYKVAAVDVHGNVGAFALLMPETVTDVRIPDRVARNRLAPPMPNPFNPTTTIRYEIVGEARVELAVYNLAGRRVRTLVHELQSPNAYEVPWDGRDEMGRTVASGVYVCRLTAGDFVAHQRMALVK